MLCTNEDVKEIMREWGLDPAINTGLFNQKQKEYLEFHRENIFKI
jgi:hypothetical protein